MAEKAPLGTLKTSATVDEILAQLASIEAVERKMQSRSSVYFGFGILALFLGFFLLAVAGVGLILWAIAVVLFFLAWASSRPSMDLTRFAKVQRLLAILRIDMPTRARVKIAFDARDTAYKAFGSNDQGFNQTWLELSGKLADGNTFHYEVSQTVKRKVKSKHRGQKIKDSIRERLTLALQPNAARYPGVGQAAAVLKSVQPPSPALVVHALHASDKEVVATLQSQVVKRLNNTYIGNGQSHLISGDQLLGAMVWLYRGLKEVKAGVIKKA
jgi:hypothetical protein